MSTSALHRLTAVAAGFRGSDQLMVAGTPLVVAALFGQPADMVGLVVAIQGAAWLVVSLPAGVMVDRMAPTEALRRGMLLGVLGVAIAAAGLWLGSLALFALGAFVSAGGAVTGFLAEGAAVQRLVPGPALPAANARLQLAQSAAMLVGPALMGLAVQQGWTFAAYCLAFLLASAALVLAGGFDAQPPAPRQERNPLAEIGEGLAFVRRQPLLRGIVACALCWNMAFFALMAIFVPFALGPIGLSAGETGAAQAMMGVGSLAAALSAGPALALLSPRGVLAFGPASSLAAALLLAFAPALGTAAAPALAFLLLGYGPILWFVCQSSIRQLVTPPGMLGRVGSVVQVAIYGVRSVGALAGGLTAARLGFDAALLLVVVLFAASLGSVFLSALIELKRLPEAVRSSV